MLPNFDYLPVDAFSNRGSYDNLIYYGRDEFIIFGKFSDFLEQSFDQNYPYFCCGNR